ncbi:DEAD/DEAH box helicase [Candidatus Contubernalis alkaliaceticus]|uniref:DEAD/DEAH box helicase n=1 Tax=Candidatus Contubernalis alkaliaceticus TaxID=338645 RepID=UPI001F4C2DDA|nr:DEAD/DEAH box helicase family protein [Candidatus Contubernalis alkalaceticus]UNC92142.1 DEAD/DEAH box helicase family protein [Candidatus Contubernalis alkalaceticus]
MVDFKKRLGKREIARTIHPCEIYETLDRASDKGPLRPVQEQILQQWYADFIQQRDVILKLHTGQGKTLIGLLILQSRINQETGPAIYLCPDNYLVEQTCKQAESFGINYTVIDKELPDDFIDGKAILITTVKKLFNGETKFRLGAKSITISTILMDDAHACIGYIKDTFTISLKKNIQAYQDILTLFGPELEKQGVGSYADIKNNEYDAFLSVPYWDWQDKVAEVAKILSANRSIPEIRFVWPLIKDILRECRCIISGQNLDISPYALPLGIFGSYWHAQHRIFMSATVNDDSFFIKGLGLDAKTVSNPLCIKDEKWSGEKMILIPSLIDSSLERSEIVNLLAKPKSKAKFGIVALVPSFKGTSDWEKYGSVVADKTSIYQEIERLKNKDFEKTLVIVNRYDGIDLPDHCCRILVIDSKPFSEALEDRYMELCRSKSEIIAIKQAQIIEQGLGRGVRGEKDYCVILLIGTELIKTIRSKETRKHFSQQTNTQVEIGLQIAAFAKDDIKNEISPNMALKNLVNHCLMRDDGWKEFYTENMDNMVQSKSSNRILEIFEAEKKAEREYAQGNSTEACKTIQNLIDMHITTDEEKGWYLQEMARYTYSASKSQANVYQISAHKNNIYLFKPKEGMSITKIPSVSLRRIENIILWIQSFENFEQLQIQIDSILSLLRFGVDAERFEKAIDDLAKALGFVSQRPDREWNEGPDNLWKVRDNEYLLIECKSKVSTSRKEINKDETGQMNNACAWFSKTYGDAQVKRLMIIPTKKVSHAAGFNLNVEIIREGNLKRLTTNVNNFFMEFKNLDLMDIPDKKVQEYLTLHRLTVDDLLGSYSEIPRI